MVKKRTSLDAILPSAKAAPVTMAPIPSTKVDLGDDEVTAGKRPHVKQQALYLKHPIHRQLRVLAFEEEKKMHDLCLEALDLLFANRGLPSIDELQGE